MDLINKKEKERQVSEEEAIKICNKFNMIWGGEISVKEIDYNELIELIKKFVIDIDKKFKFRPPIRVKNLKYYGPSHRHFNIKCIIN